MHAVTHELYCINTILEYDASETLRILKSHVPVSEDLPPPFKDPQETTVKYSGKHRVLNVVYQVQAQAHKVHSACRHRSKG